MNSIRTFVRVILALMKREARTRYGRMRFGYLWALLEPAIYVGAFVAFRSVISDRVPFGESGLVFLLTAVLTFRTGMALTRRTLGAIDANLALLTFPQVKTFDVILARIILEALTWTVTSAAFIFGLYIFAGVWAAQRPEALLEGYLVTLFFGASFGFFNATFVCLLPFWERVMGLASLPLFFISGLFFLPSSLPPQVLDILYFNPFLHVVEWVRSGVYADYTPYLDKEYILGVSIMLLFTGLFINKFFQLKMLEQ